MARWQQDEIIEIPPQTFPSKGARWQQDKVIPASRIVPTVASDASLKAPIDTAAIGASGLETGLSRGFNPLRQIGNYGALASTVLPEPFRDLMKGARPALDLLKKHEGRTQGRDIAMRLPIAKLAADVYRVATGKEITGVPRTPEEMAKSLGAKMTSTRRILAKTGEVTGEILPSIGPFSAMGIPARLQAGYAGLSGVGAGVGREAGGREGELLGGLSPMLLSLAAAPVVAASRMAGRATAPLTGSGQERTAAQIVRELLGGVKTAKPSPLPGAPLTLGQRTGVSKVLDAELALRAKAPGFEAAAMEVGKQASTAIGKIGGWGSVPRIGSAAVSKELKKAHKLEKDRVGGAFESAMKTIGKDTITVKALKKEINSYVKALTDAERSMLPGKVMELLRKQYKKKIPHPEGKLGEDGKILRVSRPVTFDELQGIKSKLGDAMGKLDVGTNARRIMGGLKDKLDDLSAFQDPRYLKAKSDYRKFKQRFEKDPELGKLFNRNKDGSFKIEPSKVGEQLLRMPDEALLRAAKIPGVKVTGREYLSAAWAERASRSGDTTLAAARNFFRANQGAFRAFYDKKDFLRAHKILKTLGMRDRAALGLRRFGSPTFEKLSKGSMLDGLIGRVLGRVPGGGLLNRAIGSLYDKPLREIELKVSEMLLNPDSTLARIATLSPTKANAARLQKAWFAPSAFDRTAGKDWPEVQENK